MLLGIGLVACEQQPATLEQWVSNSLEGNRIAEAERFLARLRAREGNGPRTHAAAGEIAWKKRDFEGAEQAFRAAMDKGRGRVNTLRFHYRLGLMLLDAGRYADAEVEFAGVARFEPRNVAARFFMGRAAAYATRYEACVKALDEALQRDSNHVQARIERVRCLIGLGRVKEAAHELNWVRNRAPTDAYVRVLDGIVDDRRRRYRDAEAAFRKALELQKRTAFPHVALADFLMRRGRLPEAQAAILGVPPQYAEAPGVLLRRGALLRRIGERKAAVTLLSQAMERCPKEPAGPRWPDPARIDFTPQELQRLIKEELTAAQEGAASRPVPAGRHRGTKEPRK